MQKETYEKLFRVNSSKLYDWFWMREKVPQHWVSLEREYIILADDGFDVTLEDLKVALNAMKENGRTFEEIYNWSVFFFYNMCDRLTRKQRYRTIHTRFKLWEVGFEDDEIDYVIYWLCKEVENMDDEDIFDATLLKDLIDDLLLDIFYFEKETEQGNVMRHNLGEIRKTKIIDYFAISNGDTKELNEDEIFLYKKMMLIVLASQEGIYSEFLQKRLEGYQIVKQRSEGSDARLKYRINYEWMDVEEQNLLC